MKSILMNAQSPCKLWSTLMTDVLCPSSVLPPLVGGVVDRCESPLVYLICCQIILTTDSPGSLLICRSLAIRLLVLQPLPSGLMSGVSC